MNTDNKKGMDRKNSTRKQSMIPKVEIEGERRKSSVEHPNLEPSIDFSLRRPSIDTRKMSIVESIPGRSTLIMTSAQTQRPNVKYENTYKLQPDNKIRSDKLRDCIKETLESKLKDTVYNAAECGNLSSKISDLLKQKTKMLDFQRYKIVTAVLIIQREKYNPSIAVASRCIWNENYDTFSQYTYKNKSLCAVGLIYALYAE